MTRPRINCVPQLEFSESQQAIIILNASTELKLHFGSIKEEPWNGIRNDSVHAYSHKPQSEGRLILCDQDCMQKFKYSIQKPLQTTLQQQTNSCQICKPGLEKRAACAALLASLFLQRPPPSGMDPEYPL
ncbi:Uncharacterized protein Fot_43184 [Forsythia ovata]|uniref:Uncharacterized protein n=1 Tax=Forsythia ovata TaxID=205694 RepID=A0ABD1RPY5_9LAMI